MHIQFYFGIALVIVNKKTVERVENVLVDQSI